MNDDLERRLRRALEAKADREVGDDDAIPPMRAADAGTHHLRIVPMLSAAALVATVAGGSAALVAFTGHHAHSPVASETQSSTVNPTATLDGTGSLPVPPTGPIPPTSDQSASTPTVPTRPSNPPTSSLPPNSSSATVRPPTSQPTTVPSTPRSSVTTPPTTPSTPTPKPGPPCASAALTLAVGGDRLVGTAGGDYTFLDLTNTGPSCSLDGYPTIAIFDGSGVKIGGPAAHRASPAPSQVVLGHGGRAEVELYDWNDSAPNCTSNYGVGRTLQFMLPGQSTAITIDYGYSACRLSVTPIHPPKAHP